MRPCLGKLTWRSIVPSVALAMLLTGALLLLFLLHFRAQAGGRGPQSRAEPVWLGGGDFPFPKDLWTNMSSGGVCPKGYFLCKTSKRCLSVDRRCDGRVECPGAEDEVSCPCAFRMPPSKFCDWYPDCMDESDERFCSYCPRGAFNCGDGRCVDRDRVCDSVVDCDNFRDENFCFRLTLNVSTADSDDAPRSPTATGTSTQKRGFLLRNRKGSWHPVCANPYDPMQEALAAFACTAVTANPLAGSTLRAARLAGRPPGGRYLYHDRGRFAPWPGCLGETGLFVECDDARCGLDPGHSLLPARQRSRIVGGDESRPGAWPWHAAVYKNGTYSCGATLVADRWLVSAAHCFLDPARAYYEVQLGMLRRRSFTPHQRTHRLDRVVVHPRFNVVLLEYDIALLRTADPVLPFDPWVRPVCLPGSGRAEPSGSLCTAVGWGDTGETADDSDRLLEVRVPLVESCRRNRDRWLCAGFTEGGRDACQGDSGGPLMCRGGDGLSWYLAGVISAGTGCARPGTPGMYTRVEFFLDWIRQVTSSGSGKKEVIPLPDCPGMRCVALGGGNCLEPSLVCDGRVDCYNAEDETSCKSKTPD